MYPTWLVLNSIVGCTNSCKYCLLQDKNNSLCESRVLGTPEETIQELINFKYYDKTILICLFPNTDIFLNGYNIKYLLDTLNEIERRNISNDLILITKYLIPNMVLNN